MTTATNIQAASNQGSNPKQVLTFEEALEQNAHQYALTTSDDTVQAAFIANLMGLLGVDYSNGASTNSRRSNHDDSNEHPGGKQPGQPNQGQQGIKRNAKNH